MHVYVHVPFCARRCSYCDFAIAVRRNTPDADFIGAVTDEWLHWIGARRDPHGELETLYFGGGTPSRLDPGSIAALVDVISSRVPLTSGAEITLEANPDDITRDRAVAWRSGGVNRVSLGVQSHDATVLAWMHRTHRVEQVAPAIELLRSAGITNISTDLIFALPDALQRNWRVDLERTIDLAPSHISLYGLTVEPHTPLARWTERGTTIGVADDRYADEYLLAHHLLGEAGYRFYEVSNAARAGFRSRHNSAYWSGSDYLGLGPSAHSLAGGIRRWNVRDWADYQRRSRAGSPLVAGEEHLDEGDLRLEQLYLGLRSDAGLAEGELPSGVVASWTGEGWARTEAGRITLTAEGWLRLDALVAAARDS